MFRTCWHASHANISDVFTRAGVSLDAAVHDVLFVSGAHDLSEQNGSSGLLVGSSTQGLSTWKKVIHIVTNFSKKIMCMYLRQETKINIIGNFVGT